MNSDLSITRGYNQNLVFDKIYSSKAEMEEAQGNDGVFPRRLVIISYDYGSNGAAVNLAMDNVDTPDEEEIISYDNTVWMKNSNNAYDKVADLDSIISPVDLNFDKNGPLAGFNDNQLISVNTGDGLETEFNSELKKGTLKHISLQNDEGTISASTIEFVVDNNSQKSIKITSPTFDYDKMGHIKSQESQEISTLAIESDDWISVSNNNGALKISHNKTKSGYHTPYLFVADSDKSQLIYRNPRFDINGHYHSTDGSVVITIGSCLDLVYDQTSEEYTLQHTSPNNVLTESPQLSLVENEASISLSSFGIDDYGHVIVGGDPSSISFTGDDWINVSNEGGALKISHNGALGDGTVNGIVTKESNTFTFKNPTFDSRGHFCGLDTSSLSFTIGGGLKLDDNNNLVINLSPPTTNDEGQTINNSGLIINNDGELQHEVFGEVEGTKWPSLKPYKPGNILIGNGGTGNSGETLSKFTFDLPAWEFDKFGHCVSTENGVKINLVPGEGIDFNWLDTTQGGEIKDENQLTISLKEINSNLGGLSWENFYLPGVSSNTGNIISPYTLNKITQIDNNGLSETIVKVQSKYWNYTLTNTGLVQYPVSDGFSTTVEVVKFKGKDGISVEIDNSGCIVISLAE